jgi:predicted DNA-binding transcriptional regulator YafY
MTPQESLLLRLAEEQLSNLLPDSLKKSMSSSFMQARLNLDIPEKEWLAKVRVVSTTQPLLPPNIQPGVFEAVSDALYGNYWLRMDYTNAKGTKALIEVMPLGLAQQGSRLYLVCQYSDGKGEVFNDQRIIALNRMELPAELPAVLASKPFQRPTGFDLKQYDADGRFGFGEGNKVELQFIIEKTSGYHLTESRLSEEQKVIDIGKHYLITATVVETKLLKSWLRGFGTDIVWCNIQL